jgi:hypothetical protein
MVAIISRLAYRQKGKDTNFSHALREQQGCGVDAGMHSSREFLIDGAVALTLACALGVVFLIDAIIKPAAETPIAVDTEPPPEPPPPPLRLGVMPTPPQYDDMGKLLGKLGPGFPYTRLKLEDLEDPTKLGQFDVLFLTCGALPGSWFTGETIGPGDRAGVTVGKINEATLKRVTDALRGFIERGGTLYASDWQLYLLHNAFPELFGGSEPVKGAAQIVNAEVTDAGLRETLGPSVELKFDQKGWYPAQFASEPGRVYLRGTFQPLRGGSAVTAPLLIKITSGQGTIIFTSFHNESVNSEVETKLLKFLVFAAVTARDATRVQQTMIKDGFKPQEQSLLSASPRNPSVSKTYTNAKRGRLLFALSFSHPGAHLKLSVQGPDDQHYEKEGTSSLTIDVPDAPPGRWVSTVTSLKKVEGDFPFTLTVGQE